MATRPELHIAVAKTKSKASDYNENFEMMMTYCEDVAAEDKTNVQNALTVYQNINIIETTSGTLPALESDKLYSLTPTGEVTFQLPTISGSAVNQFHQIMVLLNMPTVYTINLGTTHYFDNVTPDLASTGTYNIYYEYDNASSYWICGTVKKG